MTRRARVSALFAAALLAAGPAAASRGDLPPVCAAGCVAAKPGSGALFLFSGHGFGHGIGMSQYGAWGYALHGYDYQQILAHYYPGTTLGTTQTSLVRVLLADGKKTLKVSSTVAFSVTDTNGVTVQVPAGAITLTPRLVVEGRTLVPPLTFDAGAGGWMTLTRPYRGQIEVDVVNGKLRAINVVGLEDYLYGVVPAEMPSTWSPPALEAQAVASRSYALATKKVAAPFDVYADTRSQMYLGVSHETPATNAAVDATRGQVVMYGGKIAATFFSSSSGGETESIADGWGVAPVPYLISVADPFDVLSPYHDWTVPISARTFAAALKVKGPILDLQTATDPEGRVSTVTVVPQPSALAVSTSAPPSFGGGAVASALGLRSTWFSVSMMSLQQPAPVAPVTYGSPVTLTGLVRGVAGVSLEQRAFGGSWSLVGPVTPAPDGSLLLPEAPLVTTDYRLATPTAAVGYVRVRVAPLVQVSAPTPGAVAGTVQPVLPGVPVEIDVQNADLSWSPLATGTVAADGTFSVPVDVPAGTTYRIVVTPGQGFAAGMTAPQVSGG
ncbi:MAG: SpoIID/LytB domain-containing protein [Acidobacteriota bacterium]|nr:SpoIID/LytB domain-containing protein [Acidobacteriota bacterium]MDE3191379.1 SpoIID/LytB domain-containing protein [Acidobacteriota bacterium]